MAEQSEMKGSKFVYVEVLKPVKNVVVLESFLDKFLKKGNLVVSYRGAYSLADYCKSREMIYSEVDDPPAATPLVSYMILVSSQVGVTEAVNKLGNNGIPVIIGVFP